MRQARLVFRAGQSPKYTFSKFYINYPVYGTLPIVILTLYLTLTRHWDAGNAAKQLRNSVHQGMMLD